MEQFESIIKKVTLLKDLAPEHIKAIADCASSVTFKSREFIGRKGEEERNFYIIRRGRVALEVYSDRRGPLIVYTLGEDDILGWHWIMPPHQWIFDAHCIEMVRAIKVDGSELVKKCNGDDKLCHELLKRFAKVMETRLEAITLQLLDIYGDHES